MHARKLSDHQNTKSIAQTSEMTHGEGRSSVFDSVKVASLDDFVKCVWFFDVLDDGVREVVGFEEAEEVVSFLRGSDWIAIETMNRILYGGVITNLCRRLCSLRRGEFL